MRLQKINSFLVNEVETKLPGLLPASDWFIQFVMTHAVVALDPKQAEVYIRCNATEINYGHANAEIVPDFWHLRSIISYCWSEPGFGFGFMFLSETGWPRVGQRNCTKRKNMFAYHMIWETTLDESPWHMCSFDFTWNHLDDDSHLSRNPLDSMA